jgi:hypothetical protein
MRQFFDYYVTPVIAGTLVGIAAHDLGKVIGVDAPWWAWTIIFCILWTLSALLNAIKTSDSANLGRFQALLEELKLVRRDLARLPGAVPDEPQVDLSAQPPARPLVTGRTPEVDRWNAETKHLVGEKKNQASDVDT